MILLKKNILLAQKKLFKIWKYAFLIYLCSIKLVEFYKHSKTEKIEDNPIHSFFENARSVCIWQSLPDVLLLLIL